MRRALEALRAAAADVAIRTYEETGGHPESGKPPVRVPTDAPILPRPAVLPADAKTDALALTGTETVEVLAGDIKAIMSADADVSEGTILHYRDSDYEVFRVIAHALFGTELIRIAYARRMQE